MPSSAQKSLSNNFTESNEAQMDQQELFDSIGQWRVVTKTEQEEKKTYENTTSSVFYSYFRMTPSNVLKAYLVKEVLLGTPVSPHGLLNTKGIRLSVLSKSTEDREPTATFGFVSFNQERLDHITVGSEFLLKKNSLNNPPKWQDSVPRQKRGFLESQRSLLQESIKEAETRFQKQLEAYPIQILHLLTSRKDELVKRQLLENGERLQALRNHHNQKVNEAGEKRRVESALLTDSPSKKRENFQKRNEKKTVHLACSYLEFVNMELEMQSKVISDLEKVFEETGGSAEGLQFAANPTAVGDSRAESFKKLFDILPHFKKTMGETIHYTTAPTFSLDEFLNQPQRAGGEGGVEDPRFRGNQGMDKPGTSHQASVAPQYGDTRYYTFSAAPGPERLTQSYQIPQQPPQLQYNPMTDPTHSRSEFSEGEDDVPSCSKKARR